MKTRACHTIYFVNGITYFVLPCKYSTQVETVPGDKPQVPFPTRLPSRRLQRPLPPRCVPGAGGRESPSQSSRVGSRWTSAASALEAPPAPRPRAAHPSGGPAARSIPSEHRAAAEDLPWLGPRACGRRQEDGGLPGGGVGTAVPAALRALPPRPILGSHPGGDFPSLGH